MKTLSLFFPFMVAFAFLQDGSCSDSNKILKKELSSAQIATLEEQPSCIKQEIADSYEKKGDLKNMALSQSMLDGEIVYHLAIGDNIKTINKDCQEVKAVDPKEMNNNSKQLIGKPVKINDIGKPSLKDDTMINADCIEDKINAFIEKKSLSSASQIFSFMSEGRKYYMFDHGMAVDLPAYVLNENCDTICVTGGGRMISQQAVNCPKENSNSREMIWNKERGRKQ